MKFVKVKACHIPGFFSNSISVFAEETVPDEVVKSFALSQVWGGNFNTDKLALRVGKMKEKDFLKFKTEIPDEFYQKAGETK